MALTAEQNDDGATITGLHDLPGWVVTVSFNTNAITLTPPPGEHIDSIKWRKVNIGQVLRSAEALRHGEVLQVFFSTIASQGGDSSVSARGHHQRVAQVYRLALEHGIPPQEALSEHFGAKPRTTQRWITQARTAGLIGDYREELEKAQTYEGADGVSRHVVSQDIHGAPVEREEIDKFTAVLTSSDHRKRRGRAPGKGSTARKES